MSSHSNPAQKRTSIVDIRARKGGEPVVVLTAYTTPFASLLDAHADILLVGDSLGMVLYGMENTLAVTLEMMIAHGRAVVKGSQRACITVDMPFASYQESKELAFRNAATILAETSAQAVKLEGGAEMAETIAFLTERGVPVMAHIGLTPQHVQRMGGFKVQGRGDEAAAKLLADAKAVTQAGAFSLVVEGVVETLAQRITEQVAIPTIGIGASAACDGQVLVAEDMLGLHAQSPKFVKHYANIAEVISNAAADYAQDVKKRRFPTSAHTYS